MRVFVVGGAGFIGSHLVDRLIAESAEVEVLDDYSSGTLANLSDARSLGGHLKIHHLDAGSDEARTLIGMKQPEVIYHVAALPPRAASSTEIAASFASTVALLDAAREHRVPKVVVALPATVIYGHPDIRDLPIKELPLVPRGVRGVMARAIVDLLEMHREQAAIEFTALAFGSVYGPRHRTGAIARMETAARAGRKITLDGDGRQTRDFLFVDDAVDALWRAGARGSGLVINVGTGQQTPLRELWTMIGTGEPNYVGTAADQLGRFALSPVRARIHLGWSPWTDLEDGLRQLRQADPGEARRDIDAAHDGLGDQRLDPD